MIVILLFVYYKRTHIDWLFNDDDDGVNQGRKNLDLKRNVFRFLSFRFLMYEDQTQNSKPDIN